MAYTTHNTTWTREKSKASLFSLHWQWNDLRHQAGRKGDAVISIFKTIIECKTWRGSTWKRALTKHKYVNHLTSQALRGWTTAHARPAPVPRGCCFGRRRSAEWSCAWWSDQNACALAAPPPRPGTSAFRPGSYFYHLSVLAREWRWRWMVKWVWSSVNVGSVAYLEHPRFYLWHE